MAKTRRVESVTVIQATNGYVVRYEIVSRDAKNFDYEAVQTIAADTDEVAEAIESAFSIK